MSAQTVYDGYCVKCRIKREFIGVAKVGPSGRHMAQGPCPTCGTTVSRLLPNPNKKPAGTKGVEDLLP